MKKHLSKAYLAAFLLLFIAPSILFAIVGPYLDSTNYEQRSAAEKPVLTLQTLRNYPRDFEAYYNDHIPFRTQLVKANSSFFLKFLHQSPVDKVILGKDGWLFYNPRGSDGDPIADYQGVRTVSEEQLSKIAHALVTFRDSLSAQGKEFILMICPSKESIYGNEFLPDHFATGNTYTIGDQVAAYLQTHTDLTIVYPKEVLLKAMKEDPDNLYYYKTDTHWNELGGYIGAAELLKALDISMPALSELQISQTQDYVGDLSKMTGMQSEFACDVTYTLHGYAENEAVLLSEDEKSRQYTADYTDSRSILILRDSFSINMFPYLASQFKKTTFVSRGHYAPDDLLDPQADIIVGQFVERYWEYLQYYFEQ